MALSISTSLAESIGSSVIRLGDETGLYNVTTNPEGYGLANQVNTRSNRRVTDIQYTSIEFYEQDDTEAISTFTVEGLSTGSADAENLADQTNDYDINATTEWPVGVYHTKYIPYFASLNTIDFLFTEDSKTVTVSDASPLLDELVNVKYIIYNGVRYTVSNVVNPASTSATITLTEAFQDPTVTATGDTVFLGYEAITYIAVKNAITECLNNKVADMALETCGCQTYTTLMNAVVIYDSIERNMDAGNYTKASNILTYLENFCSSDDCGCK